MVCDKVPENSAPGAGWRVLVADDNPVNQQLARHCLERLGCQVDVVADGRAALAAIEHHHYLLVLMDCRMPEMDGYEAVRQLRRREADLRLPRLPVIALTANSGADDIRHCQEVGMDDFLPKPYRVAQLADMFRKWRPQPVHGASD